jgi:hypothetical protein
LDQNRHKALDVSGSNNSVVNDLKDLLQQYKDDKRSVPANRTAEHIIFGCMDELYVEYDSAVTVAAEGACQTTGIHNPVGNTIPLPQIQMGGNRLYVQASGNYTIVIRNFAGSVLHTVTGAGSGFYSLPKSFDRGIYLLDIQLKEGNTSGSIHMKIPVLSDI